MRISDWSSDVCSSDLIFGMQNAVQAHTAFGGQLQIIPAERNFVAKAHDHDALTVLRDKVLRVDHPVPDLVAKFLGQRFEDDLEGAPFIVTGQILNVLQQERRRSPSFQDARDIEEQSALRFVQKSVFAAERVLLGNTRDRERLTWEAGEQDVVIRNLIGVDRRDIAMWRMIVAEVEI